MEDIKDTVGMVFKNGSETLVVFRLNPTYPECLLDCRNADGSDPHIFTTVSWSCVLTKQV